MRHSRRAPALVVGIAMIAASLAVIGGMAGPASASSAVGIALTPSGDGYWTVDASGRVAAHGGARHHGSASEFGHERPVVGIAPTPSGRGYWLVASDGAVFTFGDALFHGSTSGAALNRPVVGMAPTPSGRGYWLVASDGGIFTYGDARFFGSTGALVLNRPIVGMAPTPSGAGYWLAASDGGIFAFGDAEFRGSLGSAGTPTVGMAAGDDGYTLLAADGDVSSFGDAETTKPKGRDRQKPPPPGRSSTTTAQPTTTTTAPGGSTTTTAPSTTTTAPATTTTQPPATGETVRSTLGAFAPSPKQLVSYSGWVGHQVDSGLAYASWKYDWAAWRNSISSVVTNYTDAQWTFRPRVVLSVPMIVRGDGGTLRDGANGAYDDQWRWLANLLVQKYGKSLPQRFVLRLGHESNILYYQWSARPESHNGATAPADFAAYWRRIFGIMNPIVKAAGTDITWDYNIATGGSKDTAEQAYPGDAYVDVVTVDFYDRTGDPQDVLWNRPLSLNGWLLPFAQRHGKPIGVDEWSVWWNAKTNTGGGDNPAFISAIHNWLDEQVDAGRLLWHHQFDIDTASGTYHRMRPDGLYPFTNSRARFLQLFGS